MEQGMVEERGGVPVGAVRISPKHVNALRKALEEVLGEKVKFRGVDQDPDNAECVLVHLPPAAAGSAGDAVIGSFLKSVNAQFLPGVRKQQLLTWKGRGQHESNSQHAASGTGGGGGEAGSPSTAPSGCTLEEREGGKGGEEEKNFTFAEIFAGIGGFRLGLEAVGGRSVVASEISPAAASMYSENFGEEGLVGDILGLYAHELPDFDVLTAGFPCQTFSNRGDQKGFADERGQLYRELVRLLNVKQPKAFVFENVVG
eukprot:CAMPEP_0181291196 /NCGR_PEP_ID=MMETSP1101-20121128/1836_1 /TAXON_ID=46948 /ORGANISM="Rhodomonas abbreviata, Strain Caron Lab Isolate" /LENGTH=257 /DNA_ID=CAMNT_0023395567 /DNA_START=388 /DNA_END=1158 /DNA_ORIENTATION=+